MKKITIALHDVASTNRLTDFIKTAIAYKDFVGGVVISRATGAAAQYGLAEASKNLYKMGIPLLILPDIQDIMELWKNKRILQLTNTYGEEEFNPSQVTDNTLIIFSGNDNGFSKKELIDVAIKAKIPQIEKELPASGELAIILHEIAIYTRKTRLLEE